MIRLATLVLLEVQHQPLVRYRTDDAFHLGRNELHLRLGLEARIGMLHAHDRGQTLQNVIARDGRLLSLIRLLFLAY